MLNNIDNGHILQKESQLIHKNEGLAVFKIAQKRPLLCDSLHLLSVCPSFSIFEQL